MHVFGQWEETRVPIEKPCKRKENMQTPHRGPCKDLNQETSCCDATVLTTKLFKDPILHSYYGYYASGFILIKH